MTSPASTTQEVWDLAKAHVLAHKGRVLIPGRAWALSDEMIEALGAFGWDDAAKREEELRKNS